jgi:excisionase family DNA binding protein
MTLIEVSETLSMSPRSVRRLIKRGVLPVNRSLGKILIRTADVDKFVADGSK